MRQKSFKLINTLLHATRSSNVMVNWRLSENLHSCEYYPVASCRLKSSKLGMVLELDSNELIVVGGKCCSSQIKVREFPCLGWRVLGGNTSGSWSLPSPLTFEFCDQLDWDCREAAPPQREAFALFYGGRQCNS